MSPLPSNIVSMLMGRMGLEPILPIKVPVTIGTILNFDRDGVGKCKQIFIP